jgi:hypothetical protein
MQPGARLAASGRRHHMRTAYLAGRDHAGAYSARESAHWWGLCAALSSYYLGRGEIRPATTLWAELAPFLLIPDDVVAAEILAEYGVYLDHRAHADIERLGVEINAALERLNAADARMAALFDVATIAPGMAWMALLNYRSLRRIDVVVRLNPHVRRFTGAIPAPVSVAAEPCEAG